MVYRLAVLGGRLDKTEWHNLVAFARTAEVVRGYLNKGSQLYVEGKLQTRSWDDKESAQKKYRTVSDQGPFPSIRTLPSQRGGNGWQQNG